MAYLTTNEYALLSVIPSGYLTELDTKYPGWIAAQLGAVSARLDVQLRKRYDVPFSSPYPVVVTQWVAAIVDVLCWLKRGIRTTDEQFQEYKARGDAAIKEIAEAADAEKGLFDLPVSGGNTSAVVTRSWPRTYTETSPYAWMDGQAETGRSEDSNGGGSFY